MAFDDATMEQFRRMVEEAVRAQLMIANPPSPTLPLPSDVRAEAELVHLAISGRLDIASGSLLASEFFLPLHRAMWVALGAMHADGVPVSIPGLTVLLEASGHTVSEYVQIEMEELFIPFSPSDTPSALRERVQVTYQARRMIEWLQRSEAALRVGSSTPQDVKRKMARWATKGQDGKEA